MPGTESALPATCIRFRPTGDGRTKNVLIVANAGGTVQHWHMTSGKCLSTMTFGNGDAEDQVYCLDYRPDGDQFAASGKDPAIKVIDDATKAVVTKMKGGDGHGIMSSAGHSNRVFSIKWHPEDENVVFSAGWDNTIQIWDVRVGRSMRSIYGPHVCGDSLDFSAGTILAGSWRAEEQLQTWDYGTGELIETFPWATSLMGGAMPCQLYAAQFSKETSAPGAAGPARYVAAGGSGACEARVFDMAAPRNTDGAPALVGTIAGMARGIFSVDWAPPVLDAHGDLAPSRVALAGGDSTVRIVELEKRPDDDMIRPGTSTVRVAGDAGSQQRAMLAAAEAEVGGAAPLVASRLAAADSAAEVEPDPDEERWTAAAEDEE